MRFFEYEHLAPDLQDVSKPFSQLAELIDMGISPSEEKSVSLRKLLESKDAAVRAALTPRNQAPPYPAHER